MLDYYVTAARARQRREDYEREAQVERLLRPAQRDNQPSAKPRVSPLPATRRHLVGVRQHLAALLSHHQQSEIRTLSTRH